MEYSDYVETRPAAAALTGAEKFAISQDGDAVQTSAQDIADLSSGVNHFRGAYDASGNTYPASGGSGTAGAIQAGDHWYMSVIDSGLDGGPWVLKTILLALTDAPGQDVSKWRLW